MNKTFTRQLLALAALALLGPAQAQDRPIEAQIEAQIEAATEQARAAWRMASSAELERQFAVGEAFEATFGVAGERGPQRVVKGAPYCADAVHETVQWLADGNGGAPNRIVRQQSTRLCRDGEGRTRQEVERGPRKLVYLHDPVARESWVLEPEQKTARRIGGGARGERMALDSSAWRDYAERMREWSRQFAEQHRRAHGSGTTPPTPPAPPVPPTPPVPPAPMAAPVVITRSDEGPRTETREVRVLRVPGGATADWVMPAPVMSRALTLAPRGAGTVTPLAPREIEGVRANGERTSWVIEAGKVGNEKPITITREVWTAPELMLTLSSRDFDPRSGEVNYRLINLKRGEPDAALMKVPADFGPPGRKAPKAG